MNSSPTVLELYYKFLEFIGQDSQRERRKVNRRMFYVLVWGFLLPAVVSAGLLVLIREGIIPYRFKAYMGWIGIFFPLVYSLYVLTSEVLVEMPKLFKRGGLVTTLTVAEKEARWRDFVVTALENEFGQRPLNQLQSIQAHFNFDLDAVKSRTRYLTAFSGAVFFLILQGLDSLADDSKVSWVKTRGMGWIEQGSVDIVQYIGLFFVLILVYLSGSQTHRQLQRYAQAFELMLLRRRG